MYSKQEVSRIKQDFWTRFGQYMRPLPSADGSMINWVNYKTGIRHVYFRMDASRDAASIGIELQHPNTALREEFYQKLLPLRSLLEDTTGETWQWQPEIYDEEGKTISRIGITHAGVNILNDADWPAIISFLKPRIIALDAFWNDVKEILA